MSTRVMPFAIAAAVSVLVFAAAAMEPHFAGDVTIARAVVSDPTFLLCDEPTAGLDPITAEEIGKLIVDLKKQRNMSAVVVTHDIRGAKTFAHRLVLLREGKIVADGTFADLQKNDDKFVQQFVGNIC